MKDVVELVDEFVAVNDRRRWAKLSSTINARALELLLLREILVELRKLNGQRQAIIAEEPANKPDLETTWQGAAKDGLAASVRTRKPGGRLRTTHGV